MREPIYFVVNLREHNIEKGIMRRKWCHICSTFNYARTGAFLNRALMLPLILSLMQMTARIHMLTCNVDALFLISLVPVYLSLSFSVSRSLLVAGHKS